MHKQQVSKIEYEWKAQYQIFNYAKSFKHCFETLYLIWFYNENFNAKNVPINNPITERTW